MTSGRVRRCLLPRGVTSSQRIRRTRRTSLATTMEPIKSLPQWSCTQAWARSFSLADQPELSVEERMYLPRNRCYDILRCLRLETQIFDTLQGIARDRR